MIILNTALVLIAYLTGSITSAVVICKIFGLSDPHSAGSNNPGATNMLRLHGKKPAAYTLAGDSIKGILPVLIAHALDAPHTIIALVGLAAFLGHIFPIFFKFKGGKGVATMIGVLIATNWLIGLLIVLSWLSIAALSRYSSVAGISMAVLAPLYAYLLLPSISYVICFSAMATILVWRHSSNIHNLIAGTETKA